MGTDLVSQEKSNRRDEVDNTFGGKDPRVIDIDKAFERAYWSKVLDVSEEELRAAVDAVGPSAQAVKDFLNRPLDPAN